ncbi:ABC transporter ATP-binding protein [Rhizobium sp. L1K21]|uniref:ABC transporter ATP-binding protein n=1 Tax=Rhizobium sp. L1K21 TaxID=2954933 RepID=UPI00209227A9|nr:ABC transporter ATP-binding protein [Rhizobium sp. L1K21]MCO6187558.1 ABC transporter ATP-binding protein [Rhizobium sp. L1K21]
MSFIEVKNLQVSYGQTPVLKDLSVAFAPGKVTALIGPNGCGKSTLLKAIMGFLPVSSGQVLLGNREMEKIKRRELARQVAYLPQESHCPDYMTLGELIELAGYSRYSLVGGPSAKDRRLFGEALEIVGLKGMASRQVNALSGGQRQRAWIAMVLAQDTDIILMDEPVNHLDVKYQYAVLELVRSLSEEHGKTVILVLHDVNLTTAFADNVVMLNDGTLLASGPVSDVVNASNVGRTFDVEADIFDHAGRLVCLPRRSERTAVTA